ncbi:hypothetical protein CGC53_01280 [Capnocytophaga leadbetteri]|jgi:hypothetical protein|uniref:Uncharacterized protein n=1 Tax=Capnocytophaga leadbetteri TaxID=327575 RepID=A0A250F7H4_9FLAO|nr:hypothetical protein CGC53_01280 [Capnocytophaga leadbetteri]
MNTQNYPTWLVPLDIAIELKEIGYKEDCYFEFSKDNGLTLETLERESSIIGIDDLLFGTNECWQNISVPTWTDVFAWFRSKGYHSTLHTYSVMLGNAEEFRFYYEINSEFDYIVDTEEYYKTYEEAQKECLKALIQTYKNEFKKNNL